MKVVHLSYGDGGAGAGRQAYRLHKALQKLGVESSMLVMNKTTSDASVTCLNKGGKGRFIALSAQIWEAYANKGHAIPVKQGAFSVGKGSFVGIEKHPLIQNADVVILRWINGGIISPEAIGRINKPIIWTLSDTWPFTGGCHYPGDCDRFQTGCGHCPQTTQPGKNDISSKLWKRKQKSFKQLNIHIVSPSKWIHNLAKSSKLFTPHQHHYIPTGVDESQFYPVKKEIARGALGLPLDKKVIAFGALGATSDPRKGYKEFDEALARLSRSNKREKIHLLAFGNDSPQETTPRTTWLGRLNDNLSLRLAYSAADIFVAPSREENLANTCLESLACGTRVVAFRIGGMPDLIQSSKEGVLCNAINAKDLYQSIEKAIDTPTNEEPAFTLLSRVNTLNEQANNYMRTLNELCKS